MQNSTAKAEAASPSPDAPDTETLVRRLRQLRQIRQCSIGVLHHTTTLSYNDIRQLSHGVGFDRPEILDPILAALGTTRDVFLAPTFSPIVCASGVTGPSPTPEEVVAALGNAEAPSFSERGIALLPIIYERFTLNEQDYLREYHCPRGRGVEGRRVELAVRLGIAHDDLPTRIREITLHRVPNYVAILSAVTAARINAHRAQSGHDRAVSGMRLVSPSESPGAPKPPREESFRTIEYWLGMSPSARADHALYLGLDAKPDDLAAVQALWERIDAFHADHVPRHTSRKRPTPVVSIDTLSLVDARYALHQILASQPWVLHCILAARPVSPSTK